MEILTMPYFWNKTSFVICIKSTSATKARKSDGNISEIQYRDAVIRGINRWKKTIQSYSKQYSNQQLSNIQFIIKEECDGTEDIIIDWWEFTPRTDQGESNGQTLFCLDGNQNVITSKFFIAKQKSDGIIHGVDEIESITTHELGHVLGLGHMEHFSTNPFTNDLMITSYGKQPNPKRRISNINLIVLSAIFDTKSMQNRSRIYPRYVFPYDFWSSIE